MNFSGKKVTVMGLGLYKQGTGIEAVKFFLRQGAIVTVTDLRSAKDLEESVQELVKYYSKVGSRLRSNNNIFRAKYSEVEKSPKKLTFILGRHREEDFKNADVVFQNPSVPADSPYLKIAAKRKIPIVNDWSLFLLRHTPKLFVGVTGTRGKSTTTALIYEILKLEHSAIRANRRMSGGKSGKVWLAGNLGVSPLAFIDTYKGEPIVAELSSWLLHHFSGAKKSPNIAVVTNIMDDHMDKYGSVSDYIADKEQIFRYQTRGDVLVLNADNRETRKMAKRAHGKVVWFSFKKRLPRWVLFQDVLLKGEHNYANVLAATAAAQVAGVSRVHIMDVLKTFKGLPFRMQLVRTLRGVRYYNDTTATTPDATVAALRTLGQQHRAYSIEQRAILKNYKPLALSPKHIILIAGGADKKLDYCELAKDVKKYCKAVVLLPGTATKKLESGIMNHELRIVKVKNMKEAVRSVARIAVDGDIVLLSPAAASFGLFLNEFDRGDQFVDAVKKL